MFKMKKNDSICKALDYLGIDGNKYRYVDSDEFYTEEKDGIKTIYCKNLNDFYRGIYFDEKKGNKKRFDKLGYLLDCSRGAVLKVEKVKKLISELALLGYDRLLIYTEDTYEIEGEDYFGYKRGRYTVSEMREIADFAAIFGIEIVPCIQVLAHLSQALLWKKFDGVRDYSDVLKIGEDETYNLIVKMIKSVKNGYNCKTLHIGFDEAFCVGVGGRSTSMFNKSKSEMMRYHLAKVKEICKSFDLNILMWHDMIMADGIEVGEDILPVCWEYFSTDDDYYRSIIKNTQKYSVKIPAFCGAVYKWNNFMPDNTFSINQAKRIFSIGKEFGITEYYLSAWGDNGAECSSFAGLLTAAFYAQYKFGRDDIDENAFKNIVGVYPKDFLLLDKLNRIVPEMKPTEKNNYSKALLYNDLFLGVYNDFIIKGLNSRYKELSNEFKGREFGEMGYLFDVAEKLADTLSVKAELSLKLKNAYKANDRKALKECLADLRKTIKLTKAFYDSYLLQWETENKPFGIEIQETRISGFIGRLERCRKRLKEYLSGKAGKIPELSEKDLKFDAYSTAEPYDNVSYPWGNIISTSLI